jgi:hypothetical protein
MSILPIYMKDLRLSVINVNGLSGGDRQEELGSGLSPSECRARLVMSFKGLELLKNS